ncbi:hypothetical protein V6R21_23435 [Limibacter armeniacum]|uniref:hypothetical protein n=1 Tax=Limibacter armeniacum TaxID=466084 RepID=UPI002FE67FC6
MKYFSPLLFLFLPLQILAQSEPTGEEIINKFIEAIGGEKRLKKIKSVRMITKGGSESLGVNSTMYSYRKFPNYIRIEICEENDTTINICNNGIGKAIKNGEEKEMDETTLRGLKEETLLFPELYFIEQGYKIHNAGEKPYKLGYYEVELTDPHGNKRINYYNVDSGLLYLSRDLETRTSTYYTHYKEFNKVLIPTVAVMEVGIHQLRFVTEVYEANMKIEESLFRIESK